MRRIRRTKTLFQSRKMSLVLGVNPTLSITWRRGVSTGRTASFPFPHPSRRRAAAPPKLPRSVALGVSVARNRQPHLWKRCTAWEDITEKGRGNKSSPAPAISPSHTAPGWRHPKLICPLIAIELRNKDETMFGTFYIQPYPILPS